jgi:hypothetical protein
MISVPDSGLPINDAGSRSEASDVGEEAITIDD